MNKLQRNCPNCKNLIFYSRKDSLIRANKNNRLCMSCKTLKEWGLKRKIEIGFRHIKTKEFRKNKFILNSAIVHNNKYDYSLVEYVSAEIKVKIICKIHGEFLQTPINHYHAKQGCPRCAKNNLVTLKEFKELASKIHNNKYGYQKIHNFNRMKDKVLIDCKLHGDFLQRPSSHIQGNGCPSCSKIISKLENKWLESLNLPNLERHVSFKIQNKRIVVDGYCKETNTIYEFYGDIFHGNPTKLKSTDINPINKKTFGELYYKTILREKLIKQAGFNLVVIWESDFIVCK